MKRYTIQFGTCASSNGTVEKLYVTQPDFYLDEFNKQKASFKNPAATDESIKRIAERVVNSRVVCKLGEYEDIDIDPKHLAKVKQALEIIKEKIKVEEIKAIPFNNYTEYYIFVNGKEIVFDQKEYDLLKEVLL